MREHRVHFDRFNGKYGKTVVSSSADSTESDVNCLDKTKKRDLYSQ